MQNSRKKIDFSILLFLVLPLLLFQICNITVTLYNSDDLYLKLLASGEFTGTPETHLMHVGYLTGLLMSCLYTLMPTIPWFGIILFSYGYLGIFLSLYTIFKKIPQTLYKIIFSLIVLFITISFVCLHLIELQYTTITAILCAASLVHFYLSEDSENIPTYLKNNILSFIFFFLSIGLRDKACIMFLPTFFLVALIKYIKNHKLLKPILAYGCVLLTLLILVWSSNQIAYSSDEWHSFKLYNTSRENIVDYNGFPDYEKYQTEYESLGITYSSYLSAATRYQILLDENINTNFMLKMDELSPAHTLNLKQMFHHFLDRHITAYADRPLNLIVYVLYFFTFLFIIFSKRRKLLGDVAALFMGRMIIWGYLLFINRPEARVTQGVYIAEFLILLAIIFGQNLCFPNMQKNKNTAQSNSETKPQTMFRDKSVLPQRILIIIFACATIFVSIKWGAPHIDMIRRYSQERDYFALANKDIRDYFYEHESNLYLLDVNSFSNFTENAFAKTSPSCGNAIYLGSWPANSPWTDAVAGKYNIVSFEKDALARDDIYFVFMNTEQTRYEYIEEYYQSKYPDASLVLCDTVYTSNGLEFYIMQIREN